MMWFDFHCDPYLLPQTLVKGVFGAMSVLTINLLSDVGEN